MKIPELSPRPDNYEIDINGLCRFAFASITGAKAIGKNNENFSNGAISKILTSEDAHDYVISQGAVRFLLADGHGGNVSSKSVIRSLKDTNPRIAIGNEMASSIVGKVLYDSKKSIRDNYPSLPLHPDESTLLALEISRRKNSDNRYSTILSFVNYGDSQFMIIRDKKIHFISKTSHKFIGVDTQTDDNVNDIATNTQFGTIELQTGDLVLAFTDGLYNAFLKHYENLEEILKIASTTTKPAEVVSALIHRSIANSRQDDFTVYAALIDDTEIQSTENFNIPSDLEYNSSFQI